MESHTRRERLYTLAESQQGLFTAQQAIEAGFDSRNHSYHVSRGNWVREARGIYRLSRFPQSPESDYCLWSLWSASRGVLSHETVLSVHGLSDILPAKIHLTVPRDFGARDVPPVLVLHHADLAPGEIEARSGFRVTTVQRALADLADTLSPEFLIQALRQALERGLLTRAQAESVPALRKLLPEAETQRDTEPLYRVLKMILKPQGQTPANYDRGLRDIATKLQPALQAIQKLLA